jgi:asparagine synthetase B (glutamine-hydrolysing)
MPLGAFLSAGLDSSSIVQLMSVTGAPVNTYSIGFAGEDSFHRLPDAARSPQMPHPSPRNPRAARRGGEFS